MAFYLERPPAGTLNAVGEFVRGMPDSGAGSESRSSSEPRAARPIPIYGISVQSLAAGGSEMFDAARRSGWRYLVFRQDEGFVVDVPEGEAGLRSMRGGGIADRLARASLTAEKIADEADDYDVRILDLHPMAPPSVWLRSRSGRDRDRFVSLGSAARKLSGPRLRRRLRRKALAEMDRSYEPGGEAGG